MSSSLEVVARMRRYCIRLPAWLRRSKCCLAVMIAASVCAGQSSDTTPPTLTGFSITPATVDVRSGAQVLTINCGVTDDLSGLFFYQTFPVGVHTKGRGG